MANACPYLGALDRDNARTEPVNYPTFENRCFAADPTQPLLMSHQATYCLSGGCRLCEQFQRAQTLGPAVARLGDSATAAVAGSAAAISGLPHEYPIDAAGHPAALGSDTPGSTRFNEFDAEFADGNFDEYEDDFEDESLALFDGWRWLGVGLVFVTLLVVGGGLAAWAGFQIVLNQDSAEQAGIAQTNSAPQPLQFEIVTQVPAEPAAVDGAAPATDNVAAAQGEPTATFPSAVTASPVPAGEQAALPDGSAADDPVTEGVSPEQPAVVPPAVAPVDTPPIDVYQPIATPTRRFTPDPGALLIPTPTPGDSNAPAAVDPNAQPNASPTDGATAEPTATPTPEPLGTPIFVYGASKPLSTGEPGSEFEGERLVLLEKDECVTLNWVVENVREVYLNTEGVDGVAEFEQCIYRDPLVYTLRAVLDDYRVLSDTITLAVATPTPTFTPTPSFTPVPAVTPTWTPTPPAVAPTAAPTATPNVIRAVELTASTAEITCRPGAPCEVGLTVTNTGTGTDQVSIGVAQSGSWPAQICLPTGVCGENVPLEMGAGNFANLPARIDVNGATESGSATYLFEAVSDGSGGAVRISVPVQVMVELGDGS